MSFFKNAFPFMQKIGKCMMLPVSVLPVAGILLGVGSANFSWLPGSVSQVMAASGDAIFANLPLLFAIGVAIGLTDNDGVAAMAAIVGYVVFLAAMGICAKLQGAETKSIMGIPSIETGVFGGIVVGLIAAAAFNRFYRVKLPSYLGFFAGKRAVPIITAFAVIVVGAIMSFIWPPIGGAIEAFSHWAVHGRPALAFTIYGVVERALIPFGLHHVWNVPFFFQTGEYTDPRAADWIAECLIKRRDKIAEAWLSTVLPLDKFRVNDGELGFDELAASRLGGTARLYRVQWAKSDPQGHVAVLPHAMGKKVPAFNGDEYLAATISCGAGFGEACPGPVTVYLRRGVSQIEVVGIDR